MWNASEHVRSWPVWKVLLEDRESCEPVGLVVAQQPSDEPEQEEQPTENQDIIPAQENADEVAPEVEGPDLEADLQELAPPKSGGAGKVNGESLPNLECFQMPAAQPDLEAVLQRQAQPKTEGEGRDGFDVRRDILSKLETVYISEAGKGQPQD